MSIFNEAILKKLAKEFLEAARERDAALVKVWQAEDEMERVRKVNDECGFARTQLEDAVRQVRKEEAQ